MSDALALHQTVLSTDELLAGRYAAFRLSDGGSDGVAYESRADAVRHQLHDTQCAVIRIPLERLSPAVCDTLLWYVRGVYDAGWRPDRNDPERSLIIPNRVEDFR